jgi:predicted NBD/HSP70 family sugar kinase
VTTIPLQFADGAAPTGWPDLQPTERRALLELLLRGAQSRVRLAERLGLSRASLTRIARGLIDTGLVLDREFESPIARGRPAELLAVRPNAAHFIGVKLTGDAMYLVLTDLAARVVDERTIPLPSREVDAVVAMLAREVTRMTGDTRRAVAIGIGAAGDVVFHDGRPYLERSGFLGWHGVPLADLVASATGLPTTVVNDVQGLAAAHHWFGGLAEHRSLVVYGIGAGIGCGVVIDDAQLTGAHGRAGRVGHLRVGGRGRVCENGHEDCIHAFVTMGAIEANSGVAPGGYSEAVARAHAGDPVAVDAFARAAYALGAAVAESVNAYDPDVVALMGEGLDMLDIAPEGVPAGLAGFLEQVDPEGVRVERPGFHFDLYARGAAVAAMRALLS